MKLFKIMVEGVLLNTSPGDASSISTKLCLQVRTFNHGDLTCVYSMITEWRLDDHSRLGRSSIDLEPIIRCAIFLLLDLLLDVQFAIRCAIICQEGQIKLSLKTMYKYLFKSVLSISG